MLEGGTGFTAPSDRSALVNRTAAARYLSIVGLTKRKLKKCC